MRKQIATALLASLFLTANAQQTLSLQECRDLALENNKHLSAARIQKDVANYNRKAAKTKYLPRLDGTAAYQHFDKEISLLNNSQKNTLSNLGSTSTALVGSDLSTTISGLQQQGVISADVAQQMGTLVGRLSEPLAQAGNNIGNTIRDAFRTNTKNIWAGSILLTQPLYMGGAIRAANDMATISQDMADNSIASFRQNILYAVDNAYWIAVSLKNKEQLAVSYRDLVKKFNEDVHKMINTGVSTRSDGLKVDVALNSADINVTTLQDNVAIAKMTLCELCGIPLNGDIKLADENKDELPTTYVSPSGTADSTYNARPEIRLLQNAVDMSKQTTKLVKAAYLPHIALTAGFTEANPNVFNGFSEHFRGVWNVGVLVQVPIWNWFEGKYKVRASKSLTEIANLNLADARSKVQLQVESSRFKVNEAYKRLNMARKNMKSAEENLRCANVGFKEGVMTVTDVMEAQTAWQQAKTQVIDAQIEVHLTQITLEKALGTID